MKVNDIAEKVGLAVASAGDVQKEVTDCYISDLLSDVMAHSKEGALWVTLQTHPNTVAVAVIKGISGIVITNGRQPEPETIKKAEAEQVTIMTSPQTTFEIAGQLYQILRSS